MSARQLGSAVFKEGCSAALPGVRKDVKLHVKAQGHGMNHRMG